MSVNIMGLHRVIWVKFNLSYTFLQNSWFVETIMLSILNENNCIFKYETSDTVHLLLLYVVTLKTLDILKNRKNSETSPLTSSVSVSLRHRALS